jgi:MFS family permease
MNMNHKNNYIAFALSMISYLFGGMVSTLMSASLPIAIPELLGGKVSEALLGEVGAYISAFFLYGWMIGGLLLGIISDRIGRKKVLIFATALYGVAALLTISVQNWYVLIIYRFFTGMGVGGVLLIATVYISEIWEEKTRPIALGILAVAFPIGIVTTGGLTVFFSGWRDSFWLGIIPLTVAIFMLFLLPESGQWQKIDSPRKVSYSEIFEANYRQNIIKGSLVFGAVLIGLWGVFSWIPTWIQTLLPATQTGQQERGITMLLLGIGGIVGGVLSGFLIKAFGSRKSLIIIFSGCILVSFLLFLTNREFSKIIYLEVAVLSLFFGMSQGSLSSYIPHLFPTLIRATASGFCFNFGRFFTATAVFFVGTLVTFLGGFSNALLSFSLAFVIALLTIFFSKESAKNN